MSKYKKSLGRMIVAFSIILLSSMLTLAVHLNISPILGLVPTVIIMFLIIRFTPERFMINGSIREVRE